MTTNVVKGAPVKTSNPMPFTFVDGRYTLAPGALVVSTGEAGDTPGMLKVYVVSGKLAAKGAAAWDLSGQYVYVSPSVFESAIC